MNNLIIRSEQLDGVFVLQETMNRLVDQISALSGMQFHALERYIKRNMIDDDQRKASSAPTLISVSPTAPRATSVLRRCPAR